MTRIDPETAGRVNAVAVDVMSAFRHTVELYWHTPQLIEAAGFAEFEDWARGQPKPQIARDERRQLAAEYREWGMTQREIAAVAGVDHRTVGRDLGTNAPSEPEPAAQTEPDPGANAPDEAITGEQEQPGGPQWDTLQDIRDRIRALAAFPPKVVAAQVPVRRRATTARELRRLGTTLARVVLALEA